MKRMRKLLSFILSASMTLSLLPAVSFAAPTARPSIAGLSDSYTGGIGEINWGDTDWGAFKDVDWDGAADKTADQLAALFDETKFNVIKTGSVLSFESDEGAFYTDAESDVDLNDLDYGAGQITFPEGDTVIISSAHETLKLIGETTLNIPDDSAVMVIGAYKPEETEEEDSYPTVIYGDTTLNINTNTSGNLAVAAFNSGTVSSWGIYAGNLNVYGTGVTAAYGGKAQVQSTGVDADYSISVKGASLVGAGAPGDGGSVGIMVEDRQQADGTFGSGTVSATDEAVIIGAGGISTDYTYGIYTSSIEARDKSSIYACGAKVDGAEDDYPSVGLMLGITDERTRTVTSDNDSNIFACGRGEGSFGIAEFYFSDEENPDAEFGGVRMSIDDSVSDDPVSIVTAYGDMAAYTQNSDGSADELKFKAPTGSVNALGRDAIYDSSMNIAEFDTDKHTYTCNNNSAKYINFTKGETADYSLYYNTADSSFYKSYDETNGYSDKIESVPGAAGDGENLTLTSDFKFYTSADLGLVLPEYTYINVNEGQHPVIIAGSLTDNEFTAGIYSMKGCALKLAGGSRFGALHVSGGYGNDKDSFGIYSDRGVNVSGGGILESVGGCVNAANGFHQSIGIYGRRAILVFDSLVLADGGRIYADNEGADGESIGMLSGALDESEVTAGVSDGIGIYGDAYVSASAAGGSGNVDSFGCVTSQLLMSDNSELHLDTYGESVNAIGLGIELNDNSEIDIIDSASVYGKASGGDLSYGLSELVFDSEEFDGTKCISVNMPDDGSMEFEGDTMAINAARRMFGSIDVKDGENNPLTYSGDVYGYVDSEGKPAKRAVIEALPKADYTIFYSADTGFRKNNKDGEKLTSLPEGLSADGNTVTLYDAAFSTTAGCAFIADGGVTLSIPENSRAALSAADHAAADPDNPDASNVFGIILEGDSVIQADGALSVSANGSGRTFGLATYGNLTVKGKGEVIAAEFFGADHSWAMMTTESLTIENSAHVYAYAMAGMDKKAVSSMSRKLTVKDDAVFDTSGGYDASGIGIWDGYDVVTEDNASVITKGGLILYGNSETKPGAIRASGESSVEVECDYNGDGSGILDWGILGASGTGEGLSEDDAAQIYVTDNASVSSYTIAENGGAVSRAKAAGGVSAVGGNERGDKGELEYKDDTYMLAGTDDSANYVLFKNAAVDYPLYFDGETSKLYKTCDFSFDQETGDVIDVTYSDPIEVPGAKCEGNKLTLTSEFQFYTDFMDGLYLGKDTALYVPEGESPTVYGGFSGLTLGDGIGGSSGIYCMGGNTLDIDGHLEAVGGSVTNLSSWGIVNSATVTPLTITGKGSLTARGGDVVYDETIGEPVGDSAGIVSCDDLNVSIAELNAVGGDSDNFSAGIYVDYPNVEPHDLTISGGAKVSAQGGKGGDSEQSFSIGCSASSITVKDKSSLTALSSDAYSSYGIALFAWSDYGDGEINLSGGSSIDASAAAEYGYGVAAMSEGNAAITVNMDKSCTFTAEGAMSASASELTGVSAVSDGKTVTYNSDKAGYVDADGNPVKKISVEPLQTSSSTSRGSGSGRGRAASTPTASPQPTTTPAPEASASPEPTSEPTSEPQATSKPSDTEKTLPFTDVAETDWFCNDVKNAYETGLMSGVSETRFEPDTTLTRGMLAAILGRMEGVSEASGATEYTDVDADAYYAPYIAWGSENGILSGFGDGTFRPNDPVTREQTAKIIKAYYDYKGEGPVGEWAIRLGYADLAEISDWAAEGVMFCTMKGIMVGRGDEFDPKTYITRAECAAVIGRIK